VTGAPLIPVGRAVRLALTAGVATRSVLAAALTWFATLAAVYASDAGPPLPAMAVTATVLFPVAAWAGAAQLAALGPDLRALLTAADGPGRALLVDALPPLALVAGASVAGVLAGVVFDPRPASAGDLLLGLGLHLLCGGTGVALALLLHAAALSRGGQVVVVLLATLASARVRWLPPDGPVLSSWGTGHPPGPAGTVLAVAGTLLEAATLLGAAAAIRRRTL
jgi:hypothetical protein